MAQLIHFRHWYISMALSVQSSINQKLPTVRMINSHQWPKPVCLLVLLLCVIIKFSQIASADTIQHRWAGDVPIMNGLSIEPELGFAFDSPNGRIVMIFASATAPASKIMAFYGSTLAQLGWVGENGDWVREEEKLKVGIVQTARGPLWRIMLQPR